MAHNLKYNKKLRKKLEKEYGKIEYPRYDNYDAIEVPFVECIPSDYDGIMGVPMTFVFEATISASYNGQGTGNPEWTTYP